MQLFLQVEYKKVRFYGEHLLISEKKYDTNSLEDQMKIHYAEFDTL
jgi:hypothetical protein